MIEIQQRVAQVTTLHQWYTQQIDAANLASISRASVSKPRQPPVEAIQPLVDMVSIQFAEMLSQMANEASSDAIISALSDDRNELTEDESERVESLTDAYIGHLIYTVASQVQSDAMQAIKRYNNFWLGVELQQYRSGVSRSQAIINEKESTLIGESTRFDSKGRAWKATRYLMVETTMALTDLFNSISIYLLGRRGFEEAQVYSPGHANHERKFLLEDYPSVEREFFHPNSPALIIKVDY